MRIEKDGQYWIIVRGQGKRESYFRFLVDGMASWTSKKPWGCRRYATLALATQDLEDLRAKNRKAEKGRRMTRAALRKQAADAGVVETGKYVEYLEAWIIELLAGELADEEGTLP